MSQEQKNSEVFQCIPSHTQIYKYLYIFKNIYIESAWGVLFKENPILQQRVPSPCLQSNKRVYLISLVLLCTL